MTRPRAALVSLSDTPWYHVVTRCVRRAYLCGFDRLTGRSFEHRRGWVELRLRQLAGVFAIDVAAYAVMSNHVHLVVRVSADRAAGWSDAEVLRRWRCLFRGPMVVERFLSPATRAEMTETELDGVAGLVATYRARLADLSWFMRVLNESIARAANREDGVRGRFWEGRFRSQAILDETALLAVMAYVDLNPIRAGIAETPEESAHTGIAARIAALRAGDDGAANGRHLVVAPSPDTARRAPPDVHPGSQRARAAQETATSETDTPPATHPPSPAVTDHADSSPDARSTHLWETVLDRLPPAPLLPFGNPAEVPAAIPFTFDGYLTLVDSLGRALHPRKRGAIPAELPDILTRLGIAPERFVEHAGFLLKGFGAAIGAPERLTALAARRECRYLRGMTRARLLFGLPRQSRPHIDQPA
ncbi:transposase [Marichromatium sp. AB32]|uniref:transposase n=1 Tax=Marichromatium sp. AB32 TaxID=2483363 RepID=UPI000F3E9B3E|nr:transposase [Marichromatium sp. AB32]RNE89450.1 transposase [Marichromatium sp. AB32]